MNTNSHDILVALLSKLKIDCITLDERINAVSRELSDVETYLIKMTKTDYDDYRFFSPRTDSQNYLQQMEQKKIERKKLDSELSYLKSQKRNLQEEIQQLETVLAIEKNHTVELSLNQRDRQRAAKQLHDDPVSSLFLTVQKLDRSQLDIIQAPKKVQEELKEISDDINQTINDLNEIIFDLYPSLYGHVSIKDIFGKKAEMMEQKHGYKVDCRIEDVSCETISSVIHIYHIIQECLLNIEKHANAKKVQLVGQNYFQKYVIEIHDDGIGFSGKEDDYGDGLKMVKDRVILLNGQMKITSKLHHGTSVEIEIPLN